MQTEPVYHWQDADGAWQLARLAKVKDCLPGHAWGTYRLVQHLYSNHLEWVPASKLLPYPSEPIPEASK